MGEAIPGIPRPGRPTEPQAQACGLERGRTLRPPRLAPGVPCYHPSRYAKISGATIDASDSTMNRGVSLPSFSHVIFSLGTAPE